MGTCRCIAKEKETSKELASPKVPIDSTGAEQFVVVMKVP